jgi:large subunit ribosomal protein L5
MEVPRLTKITLNMGVSEAVADKKVMDNAVGDLTKIAGQKPVVTKSRKAIAGFKIRDGVPIGCMVTLARHPDVRIPGSLRHDRAAARA